MTKIDIISGFLGAGKTTFIQQMIDEAFKGEQIVLIENEFGEVGIDGGFLKDSGIEITEMNSGCICCSLVGDFGKNLNEVITKYHPDRIFYFQILGLISQYIPTQLLFYYKQLLGSLMYKYLMNFHLNLLIQMNILELLDYILPH